MPRQRDRMLTVQSVMRDLGYSVGHAAKWEERGSPLFEPGGIIIHGTGTKKKMADNPKTDFDDREIPTLMVVRDGRAGVPGPLCNWLVGFEGTITAIAAGRANHGGAGVGKDFITRLTTFGITTGELDRLDRDGSPLKSTQEGASISTVTYGIEVEMDNQTSTPEWSPQQYNATMNLCAAICREYGWSVARIIGHRHWAPGRKIDPEYTGAFKSFQQFRMDVNRRIGEIVAGNAPPSPPVATPPATPPVATPPATPPAAGALFSWNGGIYLLERAGGQLFLSHLPNVSTVQAYLHLGLGPVLPFTSQAARHLGLR